MCFQILLVHEASRGTFSRVFDLEVKDLQGDDAESRTSPFESRFPINIGITGHAATTGEVLSRSVPHSTHWWLFNWQFAWSSFIII